MDYGPRTRAELEALQLERLQWSVAHAYRNVASFRAKCEQRGVSPADIRSLADIALLPFTTKADLRAAYPFGMFAVPQEQVSRVHASSGTTGRPTVVGYTANDIKTWSSLIARCIHAAGEKQVQLIEDFKPEIIMVTPSYMLCILDEYRKQGLDPRATSLRYGIFGAEPWTEAMRREIEEAFDIRASDIYGLSEVMGPGVAQEIAGTSGPTIWEDHFLPEIVDPETGEVLPDGEEGELVFTSLTKEALPIIRYRTRDLTRLLPGEGLPYRRIAKIVGRSDDMLIIRGVNVFPTQIEEQVLKCPGLAPHFLIEISRPSRMDEVLIEVEPRGDLDHEASAAQCRLLASYVKDVIGVTARINLRRIGDIPRSTGKASHVRDLRLQALSA